ncbi:MAG: Nudix hydrolase 3 [Candidatus Magasanikbacteria bacterium GW2011_GWA2_56_11]|uniref:Nudix hydrolase 3 n=1 Tax=Candidatus Magasanikbacteria bacterium GW2011_GWA2_56_11 TaxID=1619044 RepID=A0A0G2ALF2_9BACT|nr:MAG: Nudix hydrolase 3 [Candidatus Magasanikbacteria bacterium GW2011_GWA2_56_11]
MDREAFYAEQIEAWEKTGGPTRAVEILDVFIFNRSGEMLVQKRSYQKAHNPGLLDKSVGGHIRSGDTADFSVMVETVQELQTPSIVLKNDNDFEKALKLLSEYMATVAIIKHVKTKIYIIDKVLKDKIVPIANKVHLYYGIYDGSTRIVDREAKGTLFYSLPELENEMQQFPKAFTSDMHTFIGELRPEMERFLACLSSGQPPSADRQK